MCRYSWHFYSAVARADVYKADFTKQVAVSNGFKALTGYDKSLALYRTRRIQPVMELEWFLGRGTCYLGLRDLHRCQIECDLHGARSFAFHSDSIQEGLWSFECYSQYGVFKVLRCGCRDFRE